MSLFAKTTSIQIREVWNYNLEDEIAIIRKIVDDFPYVAMDTEFPGIVVRPVGVFRNSNEYHYETLKKNVNLLKLIQMGLTFSDEDGNLPMFETDKYCIWQFNFREFNVNNDVYASDSIELLRQSGIDFEKNLENGIDARHFGELLMSSGLVLNHDVYWVTFHSGYDFGYLLKLLTCQNLPDSQSEFFELINLYFPFLYDIKHLMKFCNSLHGGLNKLAEILEVERVGICHQAGSDSLLTSCTFRKLKDNFFSGSLDNYRILHQNDQPAHGNSYIGVDNLNISPYKAVEDPIPIKSADELNKSPIKLLQDYASDDSSEQYNKQSNFQAGLSTWNLKSPTSLSKQKTLSKKITNIPRI